MLEAGAPVPLTPSDYEWATREILKVAGICCKGRLVRSILCVGVCAQRERERERERVGWMDGCMYVGVCMYVCM